MTAQIEKFCQVIETALGQNDNTAKNLRKRFQEADELLKEAQKTGFGEGELAFFFGAGISMADPFNLCSWDQLLQYTFLGRFYALHADTVQEVSFLDFLNILKNQGNDSSTANFFEGIDLYELAEYIELALREKMNNRECAWRAALYRVIEKSLYYDLKNKSERSLSPDAEIKNGLVKQLCDIVQKKKVKSIITYNYDDVFETVYNKFNGCRKAYPVFVDNQLLHLKEESATADVNVYHVHGFIPHFCNCDDMGVKEEYYNSPEAIQLILSEDSYNKTANESYLWRNAIQVDTLLRHKCVFVGFSATDKNFKRLIRLMGRSFEDIDGQHSTNHYILLSIDNYIKNIFKSSIEDLEKGIGDFVNEKDINLIPKKRAQCDFFNEVLKDKTRYLNKNHLNPIWTTNRDLLDIMKNWN